MVNLVFSAAQSPPLDGFLVKSQSNVLDSSQSPSFGEILQAKAKKKQKQDEESSLSGVASMATGSYIAPAETQPVASQSATNDRVGSISDRSDHTADARDTAALQPTSGQAQSHSGTEKAETASNPASAADKAAAAATQPTAADKAAVTSTQPTVADAAAQTDLTGTPAGLNPVDASQQKVAAQASAAADKTAAQPAQELAATLTGLQANQAAAVDGSVPAPEAVDSQALAPGDGKKKAADLDPVSGDNSQAAQPAGTILPQVVSKQSAAEIPSNLPARSQVASEALKAGSALAPDKALRAESQVEVDPSLAALTNASSPVKETLDFAKVAGKITTPQISAQAADVVQQIMRQMSATLQSGPASMRLQLNPKELGAIDVQMVKNAQGVSVTFFAEQASTGRLLETQMNQLRQSLTDSGIQLSNLNIGQHGQFGQQAGSFRQGSQFAGYPNSNAGTAQPEAKPEIDNRLRPERIPGQLLGVDYRV